MARVWHGSRWEKRPNQLDIAHTIYHRYFLDNQTFSANVVDNKRMTMP